MVHGQEKNAEGHKNVSQAAFTALYRRPRAETRLGKPVSTIFVLQSLQFCDNWAENHLGQGLERAVTVKALAILRVAALSAL
jgi:hypothetical protein